MRLDTVNQCLDTKALSNLGLWLGIGLGISQVVYYLHPLTNESFLGEYHPSMNILSRKSNNEGGGDTVGQRLHIEALSNLGLGLSRVVFEFAT